MGTETLAQPAGTEPAAGKKSGQSNIMRVALITTGVIGLSFAAISIKRSGGDRVLIPAGEFLMGSPEGEGESNEHPQHKVYLDAFFVDKTEVTNASFKKFADAVHYVTEAEKGGASWVFDGGRLQQKNHATWKDPHGNGKGIADKLDLPVVRVNWSDAGAYCKWAGGRLPTEAEWEKGARGGTNTKYSFGDDESKLDKYAWYADNSGSQAHPVGQKKPNQYGLYDMHGNVWEWVSDRYDAKYYRTSPEKNPQGPDFGAGRALRGGASANLRNGLRSAFRAACGQDDWSISFGFRCAYPAPPRR
jgi:formylglycine-generating enzyme required for sulfatase activity